MHARIPLSVVLSAPGRRHAIPHATLTLPKDSGFFAYLDSSDTRLPNHPYLNGRAADPTEYDTYVGEDVWKDPANLVDSAEEDDDQSESGHPRRVRYADLVFDDVVEWLVQQLDEDWARDGVVVCGRYVVADDATWAVPSRTPTVYTPREAFMVMRCSCKLMADIHAQRTGDDWAGGMAEITIAKAMAGSAAKELRLFVPYRLTRSIDAGLTLSPPLLPYAGVCQRHTDVCFPSLMAWTERAHHDHFSLVVERAKKGQLLERTLERNTGLLESLVRRWVARQRRPLLGSLPAPEAQQRDGSSDGAILLLAVDLLFESATLPIHLLSAKVRLFEAEKSDPPEVDGLVSAPYVVEPVEELEEAEGAAPASETNPNSTYPSAGDSTSIRDCEDSGSDEEEGEEDVAVNFFRLFRDEFNWNRYIEEMESRWVEAARAAVGSAAGGGDRKLSPSRSVPADVLSDIEVKHYCVVASEASDLVTAQDTLAKRGLPLELTRPDLLKGNGEGMAFLRGLCDKLKQEASQK